MSVWEIIIGAVLMLASILITVVILLQEGREANLGVINGGADSILDKGRARTFDALMAKWTKVLAIIFFVLVFAGMLITQFLN